MQALKKEDPNRILQPASNDQVLHNEDFSIISARGDWLLDTIVLANMHDQLEHRRTTSSDIYMHACNTKWKNI
jgi:hypothetical protein